MIKNTFLNQVLKKDSKDFDATFIGVNYCSEDYLDGVQFASNKIRELSMRYANEDGSSFPIKIYNPDKGYILKNMKINDYGNITFISDELEKIFYNSKFPIFFGGDHSVTYHILKNIHKKVIIIQFDAHSDYFDEFKTYPHGSVMCECNKLENIDKIIHLGLRGNLNCKPAIDRSISKGNTVITFNKQNELFKDLIKSLQGKDIYITFDTDYLDPSIAMATNFPEPNGNLFKETAKRLKYIQEQCNVLAIDFVEYNPNLDFSNITGIILLNLLLEVLGTYNETRRKK